MNRWTEYCSELSNHKANGDPSALNCPQRDTEDDHPILRKEVEAAVQSLKKGESAGVDNIPAELAQADGEEVINCSHDNLRQDLADRRMANPVDPVITVPIRGNLQPNYLISHPRKFTVRIILNRVKLQA